MVVASYCTTVGTVAPPVVVVVEVGGSCRAETSAAEQNYYHINLKRQLKDSG